MKKQNNTQHHNIKLRDPIRIYEIRTKHDINNNKDVFYRIDLKIFDPQKENDINQLILQGKSIGLEQVLSLFKEFSLGIDSDEALRYTNFLNIIRVTQPESKVPFHYDIECAYNNFYTLQKHLPNAIRLQHEALDAIDFHKHSIDISNERKILNAFKDIQKAIEVINQFFPLDWFKHQTRFWHHDAIFLIYLIVLFEKNKQHKPSIKWTDSPIINIVQKSLSMAQVINISKDSIIKAIIRYPKLIVKNFIQDNIK